MELTTIFGPPGTGKTTRLVEIAEQELTSTKVAYLSYSKAAAAEATSRLTGDLRISTIHALAFNALGLNRQQVVDKKELKKFGNMIGVPFSGAEANTDEEQQEGDEYMSVIQYARNTMIDINEAYELKGRPGTNVRFSMFTKSYDQWKEKNGLLDFDDMLERAPDCGLPRLPVLILDEAQDCSPLQWRMIDAIIKTGTKRMYMAGDDDQAIFEWNGADPHGMIGFTEENDGKVRVLEKSHRVPESVYLEACRLTDMIKTRVTKTFTHRGAHGGVEWYDSVEDVIIEWSPGETVMYLARDRFRLNEIKLFLNHHNIPYSINGGYSNWTNKYAKAIRAIHAAQRGDKWSADDIKPVAKPGLVSIPKTGHWSKVIDVPPFLHDFYNAVDLDQPIHTRISTIHQAKGQEADTVIVDLGMSARGLEEIYRGDRGRDAELRVWYVAYTRAKEDLLLCGENPLVTDHGN